MIPTSIMFLVFHEGSYLVAIAMVLVFAVATLVLISYLYSTYEKQSYIAQLDATKKEISSLEAHLSETENDNHHVDYAKYTLKFGFTPRESELFPLLLSQLTAEEIAKTEFISLATVKFHTKNILSKTECDNRRALRILIGGNSFHPADNNSTEH